MSDLPPAPPSPEGAPTPVVETSLLEVSQDDRTMAMLAHLSCMVLAIIGPLVIFLIKKDESPFVAYHALQALVYQAITSVIAMILVMGLMIITFGLCFPAVFLAFVPWIGGVMWALKANKGEWAGYPLIESIGRPEGV